MSPGAGAATAIAIAIGAAFVVLVLSFGSLSGMLLSIVTALFGLGTSTGLIAVSTHLVNTPNWVITAAATVMIVVFVAFPLSSDSC